MKKKIITKFILVFVLIAAISSVSVVAFAEGAPAAEANRVEIMHLTDPHYIPTYYCYTGDEEDNDFATKIKGDPKLMLESYAVLETSLAMVKEANPDYLLVTGDITSNGEKQSLVDSANAFRALQNDIRAAGNTDFQILVVPGNHDVFNNRHASDYSEVTKKPAPIASRLEFAKIFSSLGYPDLTDEEAKAFYQADEWSAVGKHLPYKPNGDIAFVNSTTNPKLKFEYYAEDLNDSNRIDPLGGLTYICYDDENKLSFCGFDTNLSVKDDQRTEGEYNKGTIDWYCAKDLSKYTQISMAHHNMIKHFVNQEQFVPKFITYGWEEVAERLVSNGVKYSFTGHFHANDTSSYTSITNNNVMYEIETGATISYGAAVRETAIISYEDGSQDFESTLKPIDKADFTYLVENGLMPEGYKDCLDKNNMCDIQKYIDKKLFDPWLVNIVDSFLSPLKMNAKIDSINMSVAGLNVKDVVKKLLSEINTKVLKDYTYKGGNETFESEDAKLYAYLNEVIKDGIKSDVALGKDLNDLLLYSYGAHLMGAEPFEEKDLPSWVKDAYKKYRSGKGPKQVFNRIIEGDNGLYNLIDKLAKTPIDLSEFAILNSAFSLIGINDVDLSNIVLNDLGPKALEGLKEKGIIDLGVNGATLMEDVDQLLDSYLTDSFYRGFGRVLVDVSKGFALDDGVYDGAFNETVIFKQDEKDSHSFRPDGKADIKPTIANGRMPSELTVTFGKDPASTKNFTWFTSKFASDADLQYKVVDTKDWTTVKAKTDVVVYPDTLMDMGFILTTADKNIARHNVRLEGLEAGTKYYYRVGNAEKDIWTEIGEFETASINNDPFSVAIFSEMQQMESLSYEEMLSKLQETNKLYEARNPNIFISLGDIVDNGLNTNQWRAALNTLNPYLKNTTSVVVPGKQDNKRYKSGEHNLSTNVTFDNKEYGMMNLHYDLNGDDISTQKNYFSFDYSAVHFVVLDTNDLAKSGLNKTQVDWLKKDLADTEKAFKVVLMHKGIYTPGSHADSDEIKGLRKQLAPIFYDNHVNIVFSGYEHVYAETPLLDGEGNEKADGVLYVSVGSFGDKGKKYVDSESVPVEFGKDLHYPNLESNTFVKLDYDGEELKYQGYIFKDFYFVRVQDYPAMRLIGLWIALGVFALIAIIGAIIGFVMINNNKKRIALKVAEANAKIDEEKALQNSLEKENVVEDDVDDKKEE